MLNGFLSILPLFIALHHVWFIESDSFLGIVPFCRRSVNLSVVSTINVASRATTLFQDQLQARSEVYSEMHQ